MMEEQETTHCTECDGEGTVKNYGYGCGVTSSECCGGCSFEVECTECDGTGIVTIEY